MEHSHKELLEKNFVQQLIRNGDLVDARSGGIILGNFHERGGITFVLEFPEGYRVFGEVEGYEFILTEKATEDYREQLLTLNNHNLDFHPNFVNHIIPKTIKVIDARKSESTSKYILLDNNCSIINKFSTQKNLELINEINNKSLELKPINKHLFKGGKSIIEKLMMSIR